MGSVPLKKEFWTTICISGKPPIFGAGTIFLGILPTLVGSVPLTKKKFVVVYLHTGRSEIYNDGYKYHF